MKGIRDKKLTLVVLKILGFLEFVVEEMKKLLPDDDVNDLGYQISKNRLPVKKLLPLSVKIIIKNKVKGDIIILSQIIEAFNFFEIALK